MRSAHVHHVASHVTPTRLIVFVEAIQTHFVGCCRKRGWQIARINQGQIFLLALLATERTQRAAVHVVNAVLNLNNRLQRCQQPVPQNFVCAAQINALLASGNLARELPNVVRNDRAVGMLLVAVNGKELLPNYPLSYCKPRTRNSFLLVSFKALDDSVLEREVDGYPAVLLILHNKPGPVGLVVS